jgi:hypothetical protein
MCVVSVCVCVWRGTTSAALLALHVRFNHRLCFARDVGGLGHRRRSHEAVHVDVIEERHVGARDVPCPS